MKPTHTPLSPEESQLETALLATLYAHAPKEIPLDEAWTAFSQHVSMRKSSPSRKRHLTWHPWREHAPVPLKTGGLLAAVALLALLIACLATLLPLFPGGEKHVEAKQYQPIGLSQSSQGTTVVADKAYASETGTIIQFHVQASDDLIKLMKPNSFTSTEPKVFTIKDQTEELKLSSYQVQCYSFQHSGWPIKCALRVGEFHPPAGTTTLIMTWDILSISLNNRSLDGRWSKEIPGSWHFQFTVPYHHEKSLPDLSDA